MKSILKGIGNVIQGFDLFSHPISLHYNDEASYSTVLGGFASLAILAIFISLFTGTTLQTFRKEIISSETNFYEQENPSSLIIGDQSSFLFAIGLDGIDLNSKLRYFDVSMQFRHYSTNNKTKQNIKLVPCERQQWEKISGSMGQIYDKLSLKKWLCPSNDFLMVLQGKYTSENFRFYKIGIKQCDPLLYPQLPCVNQTQVKNYLSVPDNAKFSFYFINTLLNPNQAKYTQTYLQDRHYIPLSYSKQILYNIFISDYNINTDSSIWPLSHFQQDTGYTVKEMPHKFQYERANNEYVKLYLRKSNTKITVDRKFQKIDETLSYIGGLFSALMTIMFIMRIYSQISFELKLASKIFAYDDGTVINSQRLNFFSFIAYLIYTAFLNLNIKICWQRMQIFTKSLNEVRKQLDVVLLLKRCRFYEQINDILFDKSQINLLHMRKMITIKEAEEVRNKYKILNEIQTKIYEKKGTENIVTNIFNMFHRQSNMNNTIHLGQSNTINQAQLNQQINPQINPPIQTRLSLFRLPKFNTAKLKQANQEIPPHNTNSQLFNQLAGQAKSQFVQQNRQNDSQNQPEYKSIRDIYILNNNDKSQYQEQQIQQNNNNKQEEIQQMNIKKMFKQIQLDINHIKQQSKKGNERAKEVLKRIDPLVLKFYNKNKRDKIPFFQFFK